MLEFVEEIVCLGMAHQVTADDMFHQLAYDTGQTDGSVVGWVIFLPFLEDGCHFGVFPVLWDTSFLERLVEDARRCVAIVSASTFRTLGPMLSGPGALLDWRFFSSFRTPLVVIQMSGMVGD